MTNNPKTRNNYYCSAESVNNEITLSDISALKDVPCPYQKIAHLLDDRCILKNFQPDELFFYEIVQYKDGPRQPDNELEIERGTGCIQTVDDKTYLNRITPLSSIDGPITRHVEFTDSKYLFIQTYIPKDYRDLFSTPNTILATEVRRLPLSCRATRPHAAWPSKWYNSVHRPTRAMVPPLTKYQKTHPRHDQVQQEEEML